jgi:hypothetical protein
VDVILLNHFFRRYLSPGNRAAAELQVEFVGATVRVRVANAGDGVLVQGNVEQQLNNRSRSW